MEEMPLELQIIYGISIAIWGGLAVRSITWIVRITRTLYSMTIDQRNLMASDISSEAKDIPKHYGDIASMLAGLGYMPFGAYRRAYRGLGEKVDLYVFHSPEKRGFARIWNIALDKIMVSFMTPFDDGVVLTEYPTGRSIQTDHFIMDFTRTSILAAHERHQQRIQEWMAQGCAVKPLTDMAAYITFLAFISMTYAHEVADTRLVRLMKVVLAVYVIGLMLELTVLFMTVSLIGRTPINLSVYTAALIAAISAIFIRRFFTRRYIHVANNPTGAFDEQG